MSWVCVTTTEFEHSVKMFAKELDVLLYACEIMNIKVENLISANEKQTTKKLAKRLQRSEGPNINPPMIMPAGMYNLSKQFLSEPEPLSDKLHPAA